VPAEAIRVGVSTCLLGQRVRYDGGHKRDDFVADALGRCVDFVPVCPEVDIGLGVPRDPIRLQKTKDGLRLVNVKTGADLTDKMRAYARRKAAQLRALGVDGYVLKKDSPSCGMERVKVHGAGGPPAKNGRGLFARTLMEDMPLLPVEEEGRLQDARLRENFVERVFAHHRLRRFFAGPWRHGDLVRFHTGEKFLVLAHDTEAYAALGRLVARGKALAPGELAEKYQIAYMTALKKIATAQRHTNVLQHMAGYLKNMIASGDKQELAGVIDEYRRGLVPLVVPITLLRHHVRAHRGARPVAYLEGQRYLDPHPKELMLRNRV